MPCRRHRAARIARRSLTRCARPWPRSQSFIRDMPLVELSRIASTRYSEDFRTGRTLFARGALLAAELDDHIRQASGGKTRFRDAARYLMKWSADNRRGFRIDELPEIFQQATGVDSREVWNRWLTPAR